MFMAKFERSRERKGRSESRRDSPRRGSPRRDSPRRSDRRRNDFDDKPRSKNNRYATVDSKRNSRNRRDFERTVVTCSDCGCKCEVPFKPTSSKPVYCDDCFSKDNKKTKSKSSGCSDKELKKINEKLDLIMEALHIK